MKNVIFLLGILALTVAAAGLKDGVYPGKAGGQYGPMRVVVTVEKGKITEIEVVSHRESRRGRKAIGEMPRRIVKAGSLDVDAVTGATSTSRTIKAAVRSALKEAQ